MKVLFFLILLFVVGCDTSTINNKYFRISYNNRYCVVSVTQQTAEVICHRPEEGQ